MPFTGDDLLWMSDGIYEAIVMLASKYAESFDGSGRGVVTGINTSLLGGTITLSSGWVILGGHLCYCHGWTGSGALHQYELYFDPVYDPAGNDVFADNISRDTYKIQRASVRPATIPVDNDPNILRLSIIDEIRVSIRPHYSRTIFFNSSKTKIVLERYGKVCVVTLLIGNDAPSGSLCVIPQIDLPKSGLLLRQIPVFTHNGVWKGVVSFDPITGTISYSGDLPAAGDLALYLNFTWVV